jgi:hypothetical protein
VEKDGHADRIPEGTVGLAAGSEFGDPRGELVAVEEAG